MKCPMCFHDLPDLPRVAMCTGDCAEARQPWADEVRGYPVTSPTIFETENRPPAWGCPQCKVKIALRPQQAVCTGLDSRVCPAGNRPGHRHPDPNQPGR